MYGWMGTLCYQLELSCSADKRMRMLSAFSLMSDTSRIRFHGQPKAGSEAPLAAPVFLCSSTTYSFF